LADFSGICEDGSATGLCGDMGVEVDMFGVVFDEAHFIMEGDFDRGGGFGGGVDFALDFIAGAIATDVVELLTELEGLDDIIEAIRSVDGEASEEYT